MAAKPRFSIAPLEHYTRYAPLVALGFFVQEQDLLSPLFSRVQFSQATHTETPLLALLDVWVSILAGCRSISQINTKIRPERLLAQAWGREGFFEQSTVARVLDACQAEQVEQVHAGVRGVYQWIGQAPHHAWGATPLMVDIDLTGLAAGRLAEGSTKGFFSEKKGPAGANCAGWGPPITTKWSIRSFTRATP